MEIREIHASWGIDPESKVVKIDVGADSWASSVIVRAIYRNDDDRKGRRVPRWDNVIRAIRIRFA